MDLTLRHRNLPHLLLKAREEVIARFRPILNAHGVTEQQWRILRALAEHDPGALEPRTLCELCTILAPSLTGMLVRMEDMGVVTRERSPSDQRRLRVALTAQGRALVRKVAPRVEREYQALEGAVGKSLVREAYDVLDRLHAAMTQSD